MQFRKAPNVLQLLISVQTSRSEKPNPKYSTGKLQNVNSVEAESAAPTNLFSRSIPIVPQHLLM